MGKQTITELPNILTEGIDYDNTLAEMKAIIENNPNWKENWTSFYNSEAGSLLTQLMAWISDNLATKQDVIFNEMFIGTAQADKNKIRHLNQIGYSPTMAKSAKGKMHIETNNISQTDIILTPRRDVEEDISERVNNIFKFNGTDINGDTKIYEILQYKNGKPDYMSEVSLTAGQTEFEVDTNGNAIYAYEGRTTYEEFYSDTSDGPTFELALENIEDGSIRVYDTSDNNIEFNNVSSFVSIEAKDETTAVPYVIEYTVNKTYRIRFATRGVMTYSGKVNYDRLYPAGHTIGVLYRTTNGSLGNSPIGFLTSTSTVKNRNGDSIQITLRNSEACLGGSDQEALSDAVLNAPLSLRTMDRAVTPSDFDYLLEKNTSILKIKTYSPSNQPNGFKNYFGRNINPQEAFSFVALKKNYEGVPTSEYKNFPWITMNKEQMLNEEYCFDGGVFNKPLQYSKMYGGYKVSLPNGSVISYENARVIEMPTDFCSQVASGYTEGLALKLSIQENNEDFFANIPFSLLYDSTDSKYKSSIGINDDEETAEENPSVIRREIDKHAQYISSIGFREDEPINCKNKHIKIYLDEKTGVDIKLYETEGVDCYRFISNPEGHSTDVQGDTYEAEAAARDGIIETINKEMINLYVSNGKYSAYDENHSVQCFGLDFSSDISPAKDTENIANESNTEITGDTFIIGINGNIYKIYAPKTTDGYCFIYPDSNYARKESEYVNVDNPKDIIKGENITGLLYLNDEPVYKMIERKNANAQEGSLADLAFRITRALANASDSGIGYVQIYNADNYEFETITDKDILKVLSSIRCSVVNRFTFDESVSDVAVNSYDLAFETLNKYALSGNEIKIDFAPDIIADEDKANEFFGIGVRAIPNVQKAANYGRIASYIVKDSKRYLKIESPLEGYASSLYFEKNVNGDLLNADFGLMYIGEVSDKAIGVRRLDLYTIDSAGASYGVSNIAEDIPKTGYLILQDNSLNSESRYSTIYANYKLQAIDSLELGSVYNNFYLTGDSEIDAENKPEVVGIEGQYMVAYVDNGITRYKLDESKSDFDIRFTKKKQDTNSLASITTDLDVIKADLIKIPTVQIIKGEGSGTVPSAFVFSVDNYEELHINLGSKYYDISEIDANGFMDIIYKAITSSGSDNINIKNVNEEVKENVYNIINKAYKYQNQLEIGNFSKDSDANITFYHCDGASYESEKALYEKIFGTKYTNQEFFELYEEELEPFMTEDGGFCPREANDYNKIKLTYKKKMPDGTIRKPDYYIEVSSSTGSDGNIKYKFSLRKTADSMFPDVPFYIHFVNDRTYALDASGNKKEYDEDELQEYMSKYKITGTDIYFLKPYFKTFDIAATIHYNSNFNLSDLKEEISNAIDENFGFEKADINKSVSKSKIIKTLMNCHGVESVNITYFGFDYTDQDTYKNEVFELSADFYEILFLHEDVENAHGKIFTYLQYDN